jgi:outer membrane immunogenic protein
MQKIISKSLVFLLPSIIWANSSSFEKKWTGLYAGGNVGAIFNRAVLNSNHNAFSNWDGTCNQTNHFSSAFIGPQAGILKQFDSKLVVGIEGDFTYNFSQATDATCTCDFYPDIYDQFTLSNRNQGSIRGRLGYSIKQNLLPYFTAGGSFSDMGIAYNNEANEQYSHHTTQYGLMIGGGLEYAYSQKLSFRLEYFYNEYARLDLGLLNIYDVYDPTGHGSYNLSANNIRAAINYWF